MKSKQFFLNVLFLCFVGEFENNTFCIIKQSKIVINDFSSRLKKDLPYKTLLMIVIKQIFDFETNSYRANLSEELKISLFECIEIASRHLDSDAIEAFMVEKNKIILSQCIFVCKEAIAKEKYSKIR